MKNIHVLPTDKPSRLVKQKYDTIDRLCLADMATKRAEYKRFNIYITSDEEIKEGDWFLTPINELERANKEWMGTIAQFIPKTNFKKIILTTDQDLIKDGVQSIDDEFLEWFVKNPSCEEVEVEKEQYHTFVGMKKYPMIPNYKIIIPKEEPNPFELPKALPDDVFYESLEPKQETLEEVAERIYSNKLYPIYGSIRRDAFINGAKWQQEQDKDKLELAEHLYTVVYKEKERSYSDEEVINLLQDFANDYDDVIDIKEWFEKIKKK